MGVRGMDQQARSCLRAALAASARAGKSLVGTDDLLAGVRATNPGLLAEGPATDGAPEPPSGRLPAALPYTQGARRALAAALRIAGRRGRPQASSSDLLEALRAATDSREPSTSTDREEVDVLALITLDDDSDEPYYAQLFARISELTAGGPLGPGDKVPSVRSLADGLGIAPGTVARTYARLEAAGVIETWGARGSWVALPGPGPDPRGEDLVDELSELLKPAVLAAYHRGAEPTDLQEALTRVSVEVFGGS